MIKKVDLKKSKNTLNGVVMGLLMMLAILMGLTNCGGKANNQEKTVPEAPQSPWPVPSEAGAMLYVGSSTSIPNISSLQVGFILSADKTKIENLTVIVDNMRYSFRRGNSVTERTGGGRSTMSTTVTYPVQSPATDIAFDEKSSITGLTFTDDSAQAEVKYIYVARTSDNEEVPITFPSTRIVFKVVK